MTYNFNNQYPYNFQNQWQYPYTQNLPHCEIVKVNGRNGAEAFQMGANSSALLLDANEPIVWVVQTDGAGYKNITPYTVAPYEAPKQVNFNELEERIKRLEEQVNAKSNNLTNERAE